MITTAEEYQKYLWQIQSQNHPVSAILLPSDENVYEIDLNTRTIKAPEFLSVKEDHAAETIYFLVDRYYDNMDLSTAACIVQYKNADEEEHFFPVPFYDITTFSTSVSDSFVRVMVEEQNYKINTYYIQDENYNYVLTSNEFDINQEYYLKITPNLNKKYVKVNLTENKYTPNSFYYIDSNNKSPTFGQYCQDTGTFKPERNYFAQIDRRYVQVTVEPSIYKNNYYYFINSNGEMEISKTYSQNEAYFIFVDSQKMIFPWIISRDVTKKAGTIEFSIRFYQVQAIQGEQIGSDEHNLPIYSYTYSDIYSLNTKIAKSQVLHGMENVLEQEAERFDQNVLAGLYSEIARLSSTYQLFWDEV